MTDDVESYAWKTVTCPRCGRTYRCTPAADLYRTPEGDLSCEACLLPGLPVVTVELADGSLVEVDRTGGEQ